VISRSESRGFACDDAAVDGRVGLLGGLMAAAALAACSALASTYDGWKVGSLENCPEPNFNPGLGESQPRTWDCSVSLAMWLQAARDGFDHRDPTHAPIARTTLHQSATSHQNLASCCFIAVFELTDGTVRAIGVAHLGVDYSRVTTVNFGPDT
jgi:hypothetical protein